MKGTWAVRHSETWALKAPEALEALYVADSFYCAYSDFGIRNIANAFKKLFGNEIFCKKNPLKT